MSFLKKLFANTKPSQTVALIDVSANSVAGAYARYRKGEKPVVLYTQRFPVTIRSDELRSRAMERALLALGNTLIHKGAPVLVRATGRGTADNIFVSVDAPWTETTMRTKHINERDSFVFTRDLATTAFEDTTSTTSEKLRADTSIVGAILNGYETRDPYGKSARRVSIVTLTSYIDTSVSEHITEALRGLFHTERISFIAASSLRYQAIRTAFIHERNVCILDAMGPLPSLALVHKDVLVSLTDVSNITDAVSEIKKLAERFTPPRTLFLLARESEDFSLQHALSTANFSNPPAIISVLPGHLVSLVTHADATPPDMSLLLMALYSQRHSY